MAHARHIPTLNLTILGHAQPYCQPSAYCSSREPTQNSNRGRATETKFRVSATAVSVGASTRQSPVRPRHVAVRQVIDPEEWTNLFGRVKRHESICLGLTQCADLHVPLGHASKAGTVAGLMSPTTLEVIIPHGHHLRANLRPASSTPLRHCLQTFYISQAPFFAIFYLLVTF